jgi:hypothetical protein
MWLPVVMKADPRAASLHEESGFRQLKREEFGAFFDTGRVGYWQMVWESGGVGGGEAGGEGKGEDWSRGQGVLMIALA